MRVDSSEGPYLKSENIVRTLLVLLGLACPLRIHAADSSKPVRQLRVENFPELPSGAGYRAVTKDDKTASNCQSAMRSVSGGLSEGCHGFCSISIIWPRWFIAT